MNFLEPDPSPASATFPTAPATNPDGGWGARRTPLPAPPLDLGPAQRDGGFGYVALRTFVMSTLPPEERRGLREGLAPDERARLTAETAGPEGERLLTVRAGLRLLLGQLLDADPGAVVMDDGPCPHCGRLHDRSACSPAGRRLHFATVGRGDLVVYAVSRFPVGLGLAVTDGPDREAWLLRRKPARLAAYHEGVARGRCCRPRDGSVEYIVRYVDTAPEYCCVVSLVYEVPFHEDAPISLDPSTD
ncbi:hypothetical protein AB0H86_07315 [Streptomyces sp. NPDC050997]|uniref:hypothetical protein n=1 Tax=Streptomyces sp. NPDC050997 TaxID=3155519 RepID=UPI0034331715